jgi:hypothetical protein
MLAGWRRGCVAVQSRQQSPISITLLSPCYHPFVKRCQGDRASVPSLGGISIIPCYTNDNENHIRHQMDGVARQTSSAERVMQLSLDELATEGSTIAFFSFRTHLTT